VVTPVPIGEPAPVAELLPGRSRRTSSDPSSIAASRALFTRPPVAGHLPRIGARVRAIGSNFEFSYGERSFEYGENRAPDRRSCPPIGAQNEFY